MKQNSKFAIFAFILVIVSVLCCTNLFSVNTVLAEDNVPPVIELIGSNVIELTPTEFNNFQDNYVVTDDVDSVENIEVTKEIVPNENGYLIYYSAKDTSGNISETVVLTINLKYTNISSSQISIYINDLYSIEKVYTKTSVKLKGSVRYDADNNRNPTFKFFVDGNEVSNKDNKNEVFVNFKYAGIYEIKVQVDNAVVTKLLTVSDINVSEDKNSETIALIVLIVFIMILIIITSLIIFVKIRAKDIKNRINKY